MKIVACICFAFVDALVIETGGARIVWRDSRVSWPSVAPPEIQWDHAKAVEAFSHYTMRIDRKLQIPFLFVQSSSMLEIDCAFRHIGSVLMQFRGDAHTIGSINVARIDQTCRALHTWPQNVTRDVHLANISNSPIEDLPPYVQPNLDSTPSSELVGTLPGDFSGPQVDLDGRSSQITRPSEIGDDRVVEPSHERFESTKEDPSELGIVNCNDKAPRHSNSVDREQNEILSSDADIPNDLVDERQAELVRITEVHEPVSYDNPILSEEEEHSDDEQHSGSYDENDSLTDDEQDYSMSAALIVAPSQYRLRFHSALPTVFEDERMPRSTGYTAPEEPNTVARTFLKSYREAHGIVAEPETQLTPMERIQLLRLRIEARRALEANSSASSEDEEDDPHISAMRERRKFIADTSDSDESD